MKSVLKSSFQLNSKDLAIWILLSIPWVWPIFFQPLFWDDWHNVSNRSFYSQSQHFLLGGGKSLISPLLFLTINISGPWLAHLVCFVTMVYASRLVGEILSQPPLRLDRKSTTWITYSLPIFTARFSISVIEYAICFLLLLIAWKNYVDENKAKRPLMVAMCIFVSVSMPSVVILIPLMVAHRTFRIASMFRITKFVKTAFASPEIYLPVVMYAVIFKLILNSSDKYRFSFGATLAWIRLAIAILVVLTAFQLIQKKGGGSKAFRRQTSIGVSMIVIALFPYFAIGYNPLRSFLPNLWRTEYIQKNDIKLGLVLIFMVVSACISETWLNKHMLNLKSLTSVVTMAVPTALLAVIGPLDWDSRLWILTIPGFAITYNTLNSTLSGRNTVPFGLITMLLTATMTVSSEYFLDFQKQTAFEHAIAEIQDSDNGFQLESNGSLSIFIDRNEYSKRYTARDRVYRQYDFSGPISRTSGIPYSSILVYFQDSEIETVNYCSTKPNLNILIPTVNGLSFISILMFKPPMVDLNFSYGLDPRCK